MTTIEKRAERPPITSVLREAPFTLRDTNDDGEPNDGLTLDGYGAVFNSETIIDSWEGKFRELIAPGAMKRSFRESPPRIQFDHGRHPMIGSIPIAKLERIAEEIDPDLAPQGGAHVVARVFDNWLMQPVRDAIEAQAIDGMSFRFSVVREEWRTADGKVIKDDDELYAALRATWYEDVPDDELPVRTLKELKVPEMGPVTWPAYADTSVSVRSQVIDLGRLHEPEQRELLAQAVFIADAAEVKDESSQRSTRDSVSRVGERQERSDDAQRSTSDPASPVGERPSKKPRGTRSIDMVLRNQRDTLLAINDRKRSNTHG